MTDSRDITGKNRKFTGTTGIVLPKGTTSERVGNESGEFRFNSQNNVLEVYNGTEWSPVIGTTPSITSLSPTSFVSDGSTLTTITITGTNFTDNSTVTFIGNDSTAFEANSGDVTFVSSTEITAKTTAGMNVEGEPYNVKVTTKFGQSVTSIQTLDAGSGPSFANSAGSIGEINQGQAFPDSLLSVAATDPDDSTVQHSIVAGALPSGVTLNSAGVLSGTAPSVESDTTYTFTVRATDGINITDRQFTLTVLSPAFLEATGGSVSTIGDYKTHAFTSGTSNFVVNTDGAAAGSNTVEYLVVAGGGAGGVRFAGGGGAGGYRTNYPSPAIGGFPVSVAGGPYPITVGGGGSANGGSGSSSTFSSITSAGGGGGGSGDSGSGSSGGSGGGGAGRFGTSGGSGNSPPVSPPQGNSGGGTGGGNPYRGLGGGGATASGGGRGNSTGGTGGFVPSAFTTSYGQSSGGNYYFSGGGGGGGAGDGGPTGGASGGTGGGGTGGPTGGPGSSGSGNTGGGGGGGAYPPTNGGNGGSGIVLIRYKFQ